MARRKFETRYNEAYILDARMNRVDTYQAWHDRISEADAIIRGEFPGENQSLFTGNKPAVMNIADQMPRDVARLGSEVEPSYRAPAYGEKLEDENNAQLRKVIAETLFTVNRMDTLRPSFLMDAVICGGMFAAFYVDPNKEYAQMMRVNPRQAFPDIFNGELLELLTITPMPIRVADRLFPDLGILRKFKNNDEMDDTVEVYDLFAPGECVKAVGLRNVSQYPTEAQVVSVVKYDFDVPLAACWQAPSPDGAFRGLIDQVGGSLAAKDKMVKDILEVSNQFTYSPWEESGILNADTLPGIDTIYHHDPSATNTTFMRRVQPPAVNSQLFQVIGYLDDEQRGQLGYPSTRQGDVGVSQGSAAFVQSTQGQLTSMVREAQRGLTQLQQDGADRMMRLEQTPMLDFAKPLVRSYQKKKMYIPTRDIGGKTTIYVSYGAGAGLDRQSTDVRLLQYHGAKAISIEKMLEETDFVADPKDEIDRMEREQLRDIIFQRFAGDPTTSLDFLIQVQDVMEKEGLTLKDAMALINEEMSASQPQAAETPEGMAPPEGQAAVEPGAQQEALAAGATGEGAPAIAGQFRPPPLEQIFVK